MRCTKRLRLSLSVLVLAVTGALVPNIALADISWTGDVFPTDPTLWTSSDTGYVGYLNGDGTLNIDNGSVLSSAAGRIGTLSGMGTPTNGTVTVDGGTWNANGYLYAGMYGSGVLKITNGGTVASTRGYICYEGQYGGSGAVTVEDNSLWDLTSTNYGYIYIGHGATAGYSNPGTLDIKTGGTITNSSKTYIGYKGSAGTATVDGPGSTWNYANDFYVGYDNSGTLNIKNGGYVGLASGAVGTTFIASRAGSGAINFSGGTLSAGGLRGPVSSLTGTGIIASQGLFSDVSMTFDGAAPASGTFGSAGTISVDASSSSSTYDLGVGYSSGSTGDIVIKNGASVYNGNGLLGSGSGSSVTVTVNAASWTCNTSLYVGGALGSSDAATASLSIANGGTVSAGSWNVGTANTGSKGTVTVDAATMNVRNTANIGNTGEGMLDVRNGAILSGNVSVGHGFSISIPATGTMTVDASTWTSTRSYVSRNGIGTLTIQNGSTVNSGDFLIASGYIPNATPSGTATVTNSQWTNSGIFTIGDTGNGTLNIANNGTVVASNVSMATRDVATGTLNFDGGALNVYNASNAAWISARDGTANIYVLAGGAKFDTSAGTDSYDMGIALPLQHAGAGTDGGVAKLGAGTLTLSGDNSYNGLTSVTAGVLKLVDTTSTWTGAFEPIFTGGSASVGGGKLLFNYDATYDDATALSNVQSAITAGTIFEAYHTAPLLCSGNTATDTVTVMNTLYGDSNVDGSVNGTDLNAVLSYYNQSGQAWANGDFNFDGSVNGTDLNTVLSNYNQSVSFASTAAVPEPSTLLLMALGLLGLLVWRRK